MADRTTYAKAQPKKMGWLIVVWLLCSLQVVFAEDVWTGVERVVAVGDVHGDFHQFTAILQSAALIDSRNRWIGGKTHLVQTGDVLDRGPHSRKVMDLLMELEKQARKAGGLVHALIGNHEAMNVYGDLRYVAPEEYTAFRDANSESVREQFFKQHVEELKTTSSDVKVDGDYRKKWEANHPLGYFEQRVAFGPNGKYGKWIRSHNAVIRINDSLFLHGGISPKYASMSIRLINETVRAELEDFRKLKGGMAMDPDGPLWYRGLAEKEAAQLTPEVEAALGSFQCQRIVIGHTVTDGTVIPRLSGKVVLIDAGMASFYGGRQACLLLEAGKATVLHRGQKLTLPVEGDVALLAFLRQAAALDAAPSPLEAYIKRVESGATGIGRSKDSLQ
jgi:Calcineurin-like phosphoesterase